MELDKIICGDCLVELPDLPKYSIDAIVTDPPYELGFMGKKWDGTGIAYNVDLWRECLRVLRPGGYLLSFGGSRTYHRMACAIDDAGFILHPMIGWVQGQGFPKASNLSKMLDKDAGAEREVIGHNNRPPGWFTEQDGHDITAPATPEAKAWNGWYYGKQSLKPALEPICMAQKPPEGRMVDNIRAWGCGGVNIEQCRIGFANSSDEKESKQKNQHSDFESGPRNNKIYGEDLNNRTNYNAPGRFPANLILGHAPGCKRIVRKRIKGSSKPNQTDRTASMFNGGKADILYPGYADATGHEEIDDWLCEDGCPVKLMGEQSGISKTSPHRCKKTNGDAGIFNNSINEAFTNLNDFGTAARFFLNIDPDPFFYCAKASRAEREGGLAGMPVFHKSVSSMTTRGERERGESRDDTSAKNHHPTVKPIALMRYLCRLITPPGGLILDPFAGSGTTCMAAKAEGFHFIGIEQSSEYCEIARKRIAAVPTRLDSFFQPSPEEDARP